MRCPVPTLRQACIESEGSRKLPISGVGDMQDIPEVAHKVVRK